jgi:hypothetical protein
MVKVCPVCQSRRIDVWLGRGCGNMYKCLDCNYQGVVFIDVDEETIQELSKENRPKTK